MKIDDLFEISFFLLYSITRNLNAISSPKHHQMFEWKGEEKEQKAKRDEKSPASSGFQTGVLAIHSPILYHLNYHPDPSKNPYCPSLGISRHQLAPDWENQLASIAGLANSKKYYDIDLLPTHHEVKAFQHSTWYFHDFLLFYQKHDAILPNANSNPVPIFHEKCISGCDSSGRALGFVTKVMGSKLFGSGFPPFFSNPI